MICENCGKKFWSKGKLNKSCSQDCKMQSLHKKGKWVYYKSFMKENNINDLASWLQEEHWVKIKTVAQIAKENKIPRITIKRWAVRFGVVLRNISEDNIRRYSNMSKEDKMMQVKKAHQASSSLSVSSIEYKVRDFLDRIKINYIPQFEIYGLFLDIAIPERKLAIECDGDYWHSIPKNRGRDVYKNRMLRHNGWNLLRLKEKDINKNFNECENKIRTILGG